MRPGDKANTVRNLLNIAKSIEEQASAIENGPIPNLLNVGYGWRADNIGPIDLGYGSYHLTVLEARCLVSKLLGAIYALGGNGNTPGQAHEPIEHAFIDALKTGLTFPLTKNKSSRYCKKRRLVCNMGADYYFRIGSTHSICQDYALAGESKGITYAVLSDGCSGTPQPGQPGSPYTDCGARFLVLSALRSLETVANSVEWSGESNCFLRSNTPARYLLKIIVDADAIRRQASLSSDSLDATLLMVTEKAGAISLVMAGDGVIAIRYRDGTIKYTRRTFEQGMPAYLNYHIKTNVQADYFSKAKTFTEYYGQKIDDVYSESTRVFTNLSLDQSYYSLILDKKEIDLVLLFSDGVESFIDADNKPVPFDKILEVILDLPRMTGQFLTRSCNYLLKKHCAKQGWVHHDDFSCAGIHLP